MNVLVRLIALIFIFSQLALFGQDTLRYDQLIQRSEGEYVKVKYRSRVTGSKQFLQFKKGRWEHYDADGGLVKVVHYGVNKKDRRYFKEGTELYLNPYTGDSLLLRSYQKGKMKDQQAFEAAIIKEKEKILHIYKDFFSFSVEEYSKADLRKSGMDFVTIWQSSFEDPAYIKQLEAYEEIEAKLGDSSLLEPSTHHPFSQFNFIANPTFEYHPKAPFSIMSFKDQMPHWEQASESPDLYIQSDFARSGEAFLGFRVFSMEKHIEYLQNKLKAPLVKDSTYCFTAYLKLSPGSKYASNAIGLQFTQEKNQINVDQLFGVQADIKLQSQLLVYKTQWMKIQCTYTAKGGERYMTIGSFVDHRNLILEDVGGPNPESYYYLEDLSLVPVTEQADCPCNFNRPSPQVVDDEENDLLTGLMELEAGKSLVLDDIYFEHDKAELLPTSFSSLNDLLMVLEKRSEIRIELSGHTSSIGSYDHNLKLGLRRAKAVKKFLVLNGIEESRILAKGYGPDQPIADNATEDGQRLNRRVEFKVISY